MTEKADNWDLTMSREETYALMDAADVEFKRGNEDAGYDLLAKIPPAPSLAMGYATQAGLGPKALKESGLNLADAEKSLGIIGLSASSTPKDKPRQLAP